MKWFLYAFVALMLTLLVIFGCNSNNDFGVDSSNDHSIVTRGTNTLDEAWDQAGINHNRIMVYVDKWLRNHYDKKWTEEETQEQIIGAILAFCEDSLGQDTTNVRESLREVLHFEITVGQNSNMPELIDHLVKEKLISEREESYIRRLVQFVYVDTLDSANYADSLKAFESDVLEVDWNKQETLCLDFTAIAKHSWDFQNIGWDPDGDGIPIDGLNWGRIGRADLGGALYGCRAGLWGAVGGAGFGSAWNTWMQTWENYW